MLGSGGGYIVQHVVDDGPFYGRNQNDLNGFWSLIYDVMWKFIEYSGKVEPGEWWNQNFEPEVNT